MANPAVLAQLRQLVGQLNALQQTIVNLQASNNTLTTRIATLEAENTTLTAANMTIMAKVQNLSGGAAASGAAGGGAGATPLVTFAATPAMVNHQDLINYSTKVGTTIYTEGCKKLTTEFDMKSSGNVVYSTPPSSKPNASRWGGTWAPSKSSTLPTLLDPPSLLSTSTDTSTRPRFRPSARSFARALEPCSKQEQGKTT
jgi:hypothetical protein